jgi:hypothetical protein
MGVKNLRGKIFEVIPITKDKLALAPMRSPWLLLILAFLSPVLVFGQINLQGPSILPGAGYTKSMAVGDFDGNGFEDVIVHSVEVPGLKASYVHAQGNVTVNNIDISNAGLGRSHLMVGDLNKDGKDDVVILQEYNVKMFVCISNGSSFDITEVPLLAYLPNLRGNIVDFDNDGNLDVLVAGKDLFIQFFKGNGAGDFSSSFLSLKTSVDGDDLDLHVVDLNNDARKDVVVVSDEKVTTHINNDAGDYTTSTKSIIGKLFRFYDQSRNSVITDLDGNGTLDVVAVTAIPDASNYDAKLSFLSNAGDGTFADAELIPINIDWISTIDHADFDGDGKEDLAMGIQQNFWDNLFVLHNTGNAQFENKSPKIPYWQSPADVRFTNFDGDATPELVFLSGNRDLRWFKWNGNAWTEIKSVVLQANVTDGHIYDIDGDGIKDIIGASYSGPSIAIWYGKGNLEYEEPIFLRIKGDQPRSVVADFNNDGYGDIIYSTFDIGTPGAVTDGRSIIFSTGPRTFAPPVSIGEDWGSNYDFIARDLDSDGDIDFFNLYSVFLNDGTGHFAFSLSGIPVNIYDVNHHAVDLGYFNNDDLLDVAIGGYDGFYIFFNDGTGHFPTSKKTELSANFLQYIRAVDINNDGISEIIGSVDVIVPPAVIPHIYVLTSSGDGELTELYHKDFSSSSVYNISAIDAEDIDKDGLIDIVFHIDGSTVAVSKGLPGGGFADPETFGSYNNSLGYTFGIYGMRMGDLDNDSKVDVLGIGFGSGAMVVHHNVTPNIATQSTNLAVVAGSADATITLIKGTGTGRIVLIRKTSDAETLPSDDKFYKANTIFGQGDKVGKAWVVGSGNRENFVVTGGLEPQTEYVVTVFEYSSNNNDRIDYMITGPSVSFTTIISQAITFNNTTGLVFGDDNLVTASASSGLPVELSIISGNGTIDGNTFTPTAAGKIKLHAKQAGNSEYGSAQVDVTFCVAPIKPTISVLNNRIVSLMSSSNDNNTWYYEPSDVVVGVGSKFTPIRDGIYKVVAEVEGCPNSSDNTETIIVGPETKVSELGIVATEITAEAGFIEGGGDGRLISIRKASDNVFVPTNGTFYNTGTVFLTAFETATINGLSASTDYIVEIYEYYTDHSTIINYSNVNSSKSFRTLDKQIITFPNTFDLELGTDNITVTPNASSGLPIELIIVSGNGEIDGDTFIATEPGTVKLRAKQAGNSGNSPVEKDFTICARPVKPTITVSGSGLKTLTSSSDNNNNWIYISLPTSIGTDKTFIPVVDDRYQVEVWTEGCYNVSLPTDRIIVGPIETVTNLAAHPTETSTTITLDKAEGDGRIIIINEEGTNMMAPSNGTFYNADVTYGLGGKLGGGFVVALGDVESVTIEGLTSTTRYVATVYEYYSDVSNNIINYSNNGVSALYSTLKSQILRFTDTSDIAFGDGTNVQAFSSSELPVEIVILSGNGTIEGNKFIPTAPGVVKLQASQAGNSEFSASNATAQFCVYPPVPTLTLTEGPVPIFTSSSDAGIVWYIDKAVISDAKGITYSPTKNGIYKVSVDVEGCANASDDYEYIITGLDDELAKSISLYPNPAKDFIRISLPNDYKGEITLFSSIGKQIELPVKRFNEGAELDISSLASGFYVAKIQNQTLKFVKH